MHLKKYEMSEDIAEINLIAKQWIPICQILFGSFSS